MSGLSDRRDGDRRVHARLQDGSEVVRYDRAGKWWIEGSHGRRRVSIADAALAAAHEAVEFHFDLPGGKLFDAAVRDFNDR